MWRHMKGQKDVTLLAFKMLEGSQELGMWAVSKSRKGKEMDSSIDAPEWSYSLDDTLVLAQWDLVLDFWPTGYKIILFCCFKPLNLWSFVEAAIGNSCTSGPGWKPSFSSSPYSLNLIGPEASCLVRSLQPPPLSAHFIHRNKLTWENEVDMQGEAEIRGRENSDAVWAPGSS